MNAKEATNITSVVDVRHVFCGDGLILTWGSVFDKGWKLAEDVEEDIWQPPSP